MNKPNSTIISAPHLTELLKWLKAWSPNVKHKSVIISGPCGSGKTHSVDIALADYNVLNVEPHVEVSKPTICAFISVTHSIFKKRNAIVFHDIDSVHENTMLKNVSEFIKHTKIPIIIISSDVYNKQLSTLSKSCMNISCKLPSQTELTKYIKFYISQNSKKISNPQINNLLLTTNRDIRKTVIMADFPDCPFVSETYLYSNIFELTKLFMSQMTSLSDKMQIYDKDDMVPLMVHENYLKNIIHYKNDVETLDNMSASADALSDYDLLPNSQSSVIAATSNSHSTKTINFPSAYFKNVSEHVKKRNILSEYNELFGTSAFMRDYVGYLLVLIYHQPNVKQLVSFCNRNCLQKDDLTDKLPGLLFPSTSYFSSYNYSTFDRKTKLLLAKHFK